MNIAQALTAFAERDAARAAARAPATPKITWADMQTEHAEFRRRYRAEMLTPEFHARRAEQERQRAINHAAWAAFAAAGGPVARNLQIALAREESDGEGDLLGRCCLRLV